MNSRINLLFWFFNRLLFQADQSQNISTSASPFLCAQLNLQVAKVILDIEEEFTVGHYTYLTSSSPTSPFAVVFEDNKETGYFYATNTAPTLEIPDALHIYNVLNVEDRYKPSKIQLVWSDGGTIASLLINSYCHAVFDFEKRAGYCRNGFPQTNSEWTLMKERTLNDTLIEEIFRNNK